MSNVFLVKLNALESILKQLNLHIIEKFDSDYTILVNNKHTLTYQTDP